MFYSTRLDMIIENGQNNHLIYLRLAHEHTAFPILN